MKSTYPLIKAENEDLTNDLFISNFLPRMSQDEHLSNAFLKIVDELLILETSNGKLFRDRDALKNNSELKSHSIIMPDLFGLNRESIIIKKMFSTQNSYELRINYKYEKYRILIFPLETEVQGLVSPFATFSYGFIKTDGVDDTKKLLKSSQILRDKLYNRELNFGEYYQTEE